MHNAAMQADWDSILKPLLAVGVYAVLTVGQVGLRRVPSVHAMRRSLNVLFLLGVSHVFLGDTLGRAHPSLRIALQTAFLVMLAFVGIRLIDLLLFEMIPAHRKREPVPVVLRDMFKWLLWAVAAFLILRMFGIPLNALAVSSIVVGYILGNASQDTLGNLFAGLALNTERPFAIGDWVKIGESIGRVVDMTWRATRIKTKARDYVVIPNSTIARESITNFSHPTLCHGVHQMIGVSYEVPPNVVRETLLQVCGEIPRILKTPAPVVLLKEFGNSSINYLVKVYIDDYENMDPIVSDMMDRTWYHFKRRGIVIPFPITDLRPIDVVQKLERERAAEDRVDYRRIVDAAPVLQPLSDEERRYVVESLREEIFSRGEVLVREGEPGNTFYLIRCGRVGVSVRHGTDSVPVATLERGSCFGEMSLLTGAPRTATVTAEADTRVLVLSHTVFGELLQRNKPLAEDLARLLEARSREQRDRRAAASSQAGGAVAGPSHRDLLGRICRFFGLQAAK